MNATEKQILKIFQSHKSCTDNYRTTCPTGHPGGEFKRLKDA